VPLDNEEVRQLLTRYVLVLSAAEGLAAGMLETLQQAQEGVRPHANNERVANVADTLGMVQAWSREADTMWKAFGVDRRRSTSADFDPQKDRRRRLDRSMTI
jgi:hypothetical protein